MQRFRNAPIDVDDEGKAKMTLVMAVELSKLGVHFLGLLAA